MENFLKGRKGQLSIEFMILIVVVLFYIQTIVQPMIETAESSANDVSKLGQIRLAAESLRNGIEAVNASVEARQGIRIFLPQGTELLCSNEKGIGFRAEMAKNLEAPLDCPNGICEKWLETGKAKVECGFDSLKGKQFREITIEKTEGVVKVS